MSVWLAILVSAAQAKAPPLKDAFLAQDRDYAEVVFSPDGKTVAAGASRAVRILAVPDDGPFKDVQLLTPYGRVDELLFDPGGRFLITRSRDQDASVWDAGSWKPVKFALEEEGVGLRPPPASLESDRWIVLVGRKSGFRLWRMDGLLERRRWIPEVNVRQCGGVIVDHLSAAAWAGRSELLLGDERGHLFRVPTFTFLPALSGAPDPPSLRAASNANIFSAHAGEITALLPSADGKLCASAGLDGKVRLWTVDTLPSGPRPRGAKGPEPRWEIPGQAAAMGAGGTMLAVADAEGVGVYHAGSGTPISWNPTRASKGRVVRLAFSPNGRALAAILCRCADCGSGEKVISIKAKKRLADHGGALVIWK